jgi:hypothetical protein
VWEDSFHRFRSDQPPIISMAQSVRAQAVDDNLDHAIDVLQVIVLNLDVLKQQPEVAGTPIVKQLNDLTMHAFQCSNILHAVCEGNRAR